MTENKVIFLLGPTASGKTKLSLLLANALNAEIVNADAFSFYTNCDIMTAKVTEEESNNIKHHMINFLDIDNTNYTVNNYRTDATNVITDIHSRGKVVIVVGGSNYYAESVLYDFTNNENQKTFDIDIMDKVEIKKLIKAKNFDKIDELLLDKYGYTSQFHGNDKRRRKNEYQRLISVSSESVNRNVLRYPNSTIIVMRQENGQFIETAVDNRIDSMIYKNNGLEEVLNTLQALDKANQLDQEDPLGVLQAIGYKEFMDLYEYQKDRSKLKNTPLVPMKNGIVSDNKANEILKACILKLHHNTLKLIKKQKGWINNRVIKNPVLDKRIITIDLDASKLEKPHIDQYFNELMTEIVNYVNKEELGSNIKIHRFEQSEEKFDCHKCKLSLKNKTELRKHMRSKAHKVDKHKKNIVKVNGEAIIKEKSVCDVCERNIPLIYFKHHEKSRAHKKKLNEINERYGDKEVTS